MVNRQLLLELLYDRLDNDLEWHEQSFWSRQPRANGVYVVYLYPGASNRRVIYVGHGNFWHRMREHRKPESRVMSALPDVQDRYKLCVSWAILIGRQERKGVERYVAEELEPEAGEQWHNIIPVKVNLPPLRLRW